MNPNDVPRAEAHLRGLEALGFEAGLVRPLWVSLAARVADRERREPSSSDLAWPLATPLSLEEHLNWAQRKVVMAPGKVQAFESDPDARPPFGCAIVEGRAYELTPSQRKVLAEQWNMTPSRCVEVLSLVLFPGAVAIVREVVLRTQEHLDPKNRRLVNGPRKVVIDHWGDFMSACRTVEIEGEQTRESARYLTRCTNLLKRATEQGVVHHVSTAGSLSHAWLAECEARGITYKLNTEEAEKERQVAIREVLRTLLLSRGEPGLAKLVREPFFLGDKSEVVNAEFAAASLELDNLLSSYKKSS